MSFFYRLKHAFTKKTESEIQFDVRVEFSVPEWWPTTASSDPGKMSIAIRSLSDFPIQLEEVGFQIGATVYIPVSTESLISAVRLPYELYSRGHTVFVEHFDIQPYASILRKRPRAYARCSSKPGGDLRSITRSFEIDVFEVLLPLLEEGAEPGATDNPDDAQRI